ncbi:MAG: glutamate racemase [Bacteroidales bacterium]|nr:glutamate racemase [Bacteroidales bacterium]
MIGVYDSGVGGLSVWRELVKLMPDEDYVYFSDAAYCPYGPKDPAFIVERASAVTDFFLEKGCELIVVACNTATAAAISHLRAHYAIPFVGMEPAIKPAILRSRSGVVGVLATAGTFKGKLYLSTLARFAGDVKVIERVGEGLVETVEKGILDGPEVEALVRRCIDPMLEAGADHIVLGCTHYPFLQPVIERLAGDSVTVVNPAPAVARQAKRLLGKIKDPKQEQSIGSTEFHSSSKDVSILLRLASL